MNHRNHHLKAAACWAAGIIEVALLAWWYSAAEHLPYWHAGFCTFANATSKGGDCQDRGIGYLIEFLGLATALPLFTFAVGYLFSHLTMRNVHQALTPPREDRSS